VKGMPGVHSKLNVQVVGGEPVPPDAKRLHEEMSRRLRTALQRSPGIRLSKLARRGLGMSIVIIPSARDSPSCASFTSRAAMKHRALRRPIVGRERIPGGWECRR
jgi:hypothetical protein